MFVGKFSTNVDMAAVFNRNVQSKNDEQGLKKDSLKKDSTEQDKNGVINIKVDANVFMPAEKNKASKADILSMQKERLQKRVDELGKKLAEIAGAKDALLFEEQTVIGEDGKEKTVKVRRILNSLEEEQLVKLGNQEEGLNKSINYLTKELSGMDEKIKAALVEDLKQNAEKEIDKSKDKKGNKKETVSEEEQQAKNEKEQFQMFTESDAVKKYVKQGRILLAQQNMKKGYLESSMAVQRFEKAASEQRAAASQAAASVQTGHLSPEDASFERAKAYAEVGSTSDTSILKEKAMISMGEFAPGESGAAKELIKVNAAIDGINNSINHQISKLNKMLRSKDGVDDERKTETQEENQDTKLKDNKDETQNNSQNISLDENLNEGQNESKNEDKDQ